MNVCLYGRTEFGLRSRRTVEALTLTPTLHRQRRREYQNAEKNAHDQLLELQRTRSVVLASGAYFGLGLKI